MDRRQKRTRKAVFEAFITLLERKAYEKITIQDIIAEADVGRSTFYAHFETKEELLHSICDELLAHVIQAAGDGTHTHGLKESDGTPLSAICHSLKHLQENDYSILRLLTCESHAIFLGYFRTAVQEMVRLQLPVKDAAARLGVPEDYLCWHITEGYLALVDWWLRQKPQLTPQELDKCFRAVTEPLLKA